MNQSITEYELYLYLSFVPRFKEASLDWVLQDIDRQVDPGPDDFSWWVAEGVKSFKQVMAEEASAVPKDFTHIMPLSGGLDSRAVLGGLLENVPTSQIVAATYGFPGSWDLEIATTLARRYSLRHEVFDLTDEKWDIDELIKAGKRLTQPVSIYQSYVRQKITNCFGNDCVYWSGYMGDALGWMEIPVPNKNRHDAVEFLLGPLITKNYGSVEFHRRIVNMALTEFPWDQMAKSQSRYGMDLQLQIGVQQQQLTGPIVLVPGYSFVAPFLNKRWVDYSSRIPFKWLFDRRLMKKIVHTAYGELSKFPTTGTAGMRVDASLPEIYLGKAIAKIRPYIQRRDPYFSHPRTNYINWGEALRHKTPLQETVYTTLQELKKRAIFDNKELDAWWHDHLNRKKNYATLLMNLSSLELLLKAGVMSPGGGSGLWN